jgi:hypothetical protein
LRDRIFFSWVVIFALVTGGLNLLLNPATPATPSVGGGGYDLSRPVYTLLLLTFLVLWTLAMAVTGLVSQNRHMARRAYLLAVIGALTAIMSFVIYGQNIY